MNIFLTVVLISSVIYLIEAGEYQVHNKPDYLSLTSNDEDLGQITVSDFTNNLQTLLGLSSDQSNKPVFYSTRPLEIPSTTWLIHVEGLNQLFKTGTSLHDNGEFDIESIRSKLSGTNDNDALNIGSILITSESDINDFEQTLKNQISQLKDQGSIKYLVVVCDECSSEKSMQHIYSQLQKIIDEIVANNPQTLAITLTTQESARVRRARAIEITSSNVTIATMYSDEYPVMFNLFFWTSLLLVLIIISIVYVFLTLDPGADTIIYRMTAPRLKAE